MRPIRAVLLTEYGPRADIGWKPPIELINIADPPPLFCNWKFVIGEQKNRHAYLPSYEAHIL